MTNPIVLPIIFQYLASFLGFCFASISYLLLVWNKKVTPNLSTWLLWALAPMSSFLVSVLSGTSGLDILVVFMAGFGPALIVLAALIKKQFYLESRWLDILCFVLAIAGLIVYFTTRSVLTSQILLVSVDFIGCVPLLAKIWFSETENEPLNVFIIYTLVQSIGLLTQSTFSVGSSLFLGYLVLINILVSVSIIFKDFKLKQAK
jgi:hypothetical protein